MLVTGRQKEHGLKVTVIVILLQPNKHVIAVKSSTLQAETDGVVMQEMDCT
jgi:hypothetical protein